MLPTYSQWMLPDCNMKLFWSCQLALRDHFEPYKGQRNQMNCLHFCQTFNTPMQIWREGVIEKFKHSIITLFTAKAQSTDTHCTTKPTLALAASSGRQEGETLALSAEELEIWMCFSPFPWWCEQVAKRVRKVATSSASRQVGNTCSLAPNMARNRTRLYVEC